MTLYLYHNQGNFNPEKASEWLDDNEYKKYKRSLVEKWNIDRPNEGSKKEDKVGWFLARELIDSFAPLELSFTGKTLHIIVVQTERGVELVTKKLEKRKYLFHKWGGCLRFILTEGEIPSLPSSIKTHTFKIE